MSKQRPDSAAGPERAPTRAGGADRPSAVFGPWFIALAALVSVTALASLAIPDASDGWLAGQGVPVTDRAGVLALAGGGGMFALAAGLLARRRIRTLGRIHGALRSFERGEESLGALCIASENSLADAWNRLVAWRGAQADQALATAPLSGAGEHASQGGEAFTDMLWHGVMILDEQLVIRYANGAAGVFLRARRETLQGTDARQVIQDERVLGAVVQAAETGSRQKQVFDVGSVADVDAGVLRFSVRASPREGGRRILVVIEDVTQQRVSEDVQHAFIAQAAHELRTPLTNIRLYIEQLIEDELDAAERGTALNVLNQETGRLDRIVSDMLSLAEIQSGRMNVQTGDVRIQQLIESLEPDYAPLAAHKHLTLVFDMPPKFPAVRGDREKIGIVLHNLLGNAVKYTPPGGTVRVSTREQGDRLVIDFIDTGIGIAEDDISRIFERFARARDSRVEAEAGTGLGLALARDLARLHGGDVTVRSELDSGSTFTFWLPIAEATSARAA